MGRTDEGEGVTAEFRRRVEQTNAGKGPMPWEETDGWWWDTPLLIFTFALALLVSLAAFAYFSR